MALNTKYKVVRADTVADLEERVEREMENGWQPTGGLTAITYTMTSIFLQAMVC